MVSYLTPGFPDFLFEAFARVLDAELELVSEVSGPTPDDDPFREGRFDLGWMCSTAYVGLVLDADEPSVRPVGVAWVPDDPGAKGAPVYFGDLVVRPDSEIGSLAELAGRRIACNDPVSLSGHYSLRFALTESGADPDTFADLVFTGGHQRSIDRLLGGEFDAAVIDSVVRVTRARHDDAVAELKVVERLGPWPVQPLVARTDLPGDVVERVKQTLLDANSLPDVAAALEAAALSALVPVEIDHYTPVRHALARERARG